MNRTIKFRQRLKDDTWHYWGFISEGHFVSPVLNSKTYQDALKNSQQYTGFKDKNGKMIFEGNIINKQEQYKYEVIFKDGAFGVFTSNYGWKLLSEFKQIKIIGDIYENKDLLK